MIYSAEADIVQFLDSLLQGLKPYAEAYEIQISFTSDIKRQRIYYQPFLLAQSINQLICNIINLLPPHSSIFMRLFYGADQQCLQLEIENNNLNLIRVNDICTQSIYLFSGLALIEGTRYNLKLSLQHPTFDSSLVEYVKTNSPNLPQFYKEFQKRFHTHNTQTEKLIATLQQKKPQEAAFIQKINTVIKLNLDNENFDTNALCKSMSLSRTQLFRRLKMLIKLAPANYIKFLRLQKAKELLETTDFTVSQITCKTGFQTVSHFTKIFKKQYGILPSVFRKIKPNATNE